MLKKLSLLLLMACTFGCHKNQEQKTSGCATGQVCTDIFATIGIKFTDKSGNALAVQNFSAVNQRTHVKMFPTIAYNTVPGFYVVVDDSNRSQLSTEGDDVLITATNPVTNQTKTTILKMSGGCNCHVARLSGVETLTFD